MTDGEKAQLTLVAFGAAGSAVALSLQKIRPERNRWVRVARGVVSFVSGICCAVLIAPLASPSADHFLRLDPGSTKPLLGFIFGITGYELCKVVFHRCTRFLNALVDKKEREFAGDSTTIVEKGGTGESNG